ncbi:M35 family metallo-endopeptidase [Paraburkholderia tagetis]|uniref:M35 family metallo-endopeptidase n=1 Tax=Paraburkholderia tagetis TaxID=2913261 RepID=A0A9X1UK30_9BURK|nr:M35 family metallo-endopeptidase [Paraburkholderia tagetis]MCG5071981.1 M35 family metallo-endopeptidase [Paraburkholderia tagetis]
MTDKTEWVIAHDTACTNTNPDSCVEVILDPTPICSNMSNKEFRNSIIKSRDEAVILIQSRIAALARWDASEQARAKKWLGRSDSTTRSILTAGLPKLLDVMRNLKPENIIRWDQQKQRNITCTIFPDNGATDAAVCKPDTEKRIIAIYPHFCTSPRSQLWHGCQVLTLIHECTHFTDVFNSTDDMYGVTVGLSFWAQDNPDKAIRNADSLACYVGFKD